MTKTLEKQILNFNNNYKLTDNFEQRELSVSIVIPYFESNNTINECLKSVITSARKFGGLFEIIVVDDGSIQYTAITSIKKDLANEVKVLNIKKNKGRYYSRNFGLKQTKNDLIFFIDSDVIIYPELIKNQVKTHLNQISQGRSCITFCLFNFVEGKNKDNFNFDITNDFRDHCIYQKSWKGSDEDERFANTEYRLLKQTNNLKDWPKSGKLGPWVLPNMVLGGCFASMKVQSIAVNGCSGDFGAYGFEETSLVTKLMAKFNAFVIPVVDRYSIHIYDESSAIDKGKRDSLFQKTHAIYFNQYIKQTIDEAIQKDKPYFQEE